MKRRGFLVAALAAVAGVFGLGRARAREEYTGPPLRIVRRWDGRGWARVRMFDLRKGDRFTVEQVPGVWVAESDPWQGEPGKPVRVDQRCTAPWGVTAREVTLLEMPPGA